MFELMVLGALAIAAMAVLGVLGAVASLVCWVFFLPFKLLGLVFRSFAFLLALPFLLIAGLIGVAVFGVGIFLFLFPAIPLVLILLGIWWLARRRPGHPTPASP